MNGAGGILSGLVGVVDEIKDFFTGSQGGSSYSLLDTRLNDIATLALDIWKDADGVEESLLAILKMVALLPLILGFIACGALIFYTEIVEKILLATAPIFIFCLMWGWLKDSFSQYATALVSNALVVIVARTIQKSLFDFFEKLTALDNMNVYMLAFMFVIVAWFSKEFLAYMISVVAKLSRVTADSFPTSMNPNGARFLLLKKKWKR